PDGQQLAAGLGDGSVLLVDAATGNQGKKLTPHKEAVSGLAFTAKGDLLLTGGHDKTVKTLRLPDGAETASVEFPAAVTSVAVAPDGSRVAAASGGTIKIWQPGDNAPQPAEVKGERVLAFS